LCLGKRANKEEIDRAETNTTGRESSRKKTKHKTKKKKNFGKVRQGRNVGEKSPTGEPEGKPVAKPFRGKIDRGLKEPRKGQFEKERTTKSRGEGSEWPRRRRKRRN